jgi:hypothetical protein
VEWTTAELPNQDQAPRQQIATKSTMLGSILFDITFLGFGGALLISIINVQESLISLAIGVLAAFAHNAIADTPRGPRSGRRSANLASVSLHFCVMQGGMAH